MNKKSRTFTTFIISFIISYLIVGYIKNTMFVAIHWVEGASIWNKLREYYVRTFSENIVPALIIAIIAAGVISFKNRSRN